MNESKTFPKFFQRERKESKINFNKFKDNLKKLKNQTLTKTQKPDLALEYEFETIKQDLDKEAVEILNQNSRHTQKVISEIIMYGFYVKLESMSDIENNNYIENLKKMSTKDAFLEIIRNYKDFLNELSKQTYLHFEDELKLAESMETVLQRSSFTDFLEKIKNNKGDGMTLKDFEVLSSSQLPTAQNMVDFQKKQLAEIFLEIFKSNSL